MLSRSRHCYDVRNKFLLQHRIGKDSRWVNAYDFLSRLGFDKFIVYEEANRLFVFSSIWGFEVNEQIRSHNV